MDTDGDPPQAPGLPPRPFGVSGNPMTKGSSISVFLYMDYRDFLKDWFHLTKGKHPQFSLRAFAQKAGFRSHNFFKMVMLGQRNLAGESVRKITRALRLDRHEADYFAALIAYNQETENTLRQKLYETLLQAQEIHHVRTLVQDQYQYYAAWYHTAVRELVSHPEFRGDPQWIARRLSPAITPAQARESLDLLQKLGLIERNREGGLRQTDKLLTTGPEVHSRRIAQYHWSLLDLAKSAIDRFPRNNRDISCLTLGISLEMIPVLKRRIQLFREEVMRLISTDQKTDTVIQLNLQLFPLTDLGQKEVRHG